MRNHAAIESSYDAVVVGARVAGASTALLLARAGLHVLVVDKGTHGSDTTSTHALMRAGVMQLHRWGVLERVTAAGTPAIRTTTFHYNDEAIEIPIKASDGIDALYAPRRTLLDAILADAAAESGAHVRYGARVTGVVRDTAGRVAAVELLDADGTPRRVDAGIVIGADGVRSATARAVGAEPLHTGNRPSAVIYGYFHGLPDDGTHWHFGNGVAAGVIPTNDGATCVFASMPPQRHAQKRATGLDALFRRVILENSPRLAHGLSRARAAGKLHPFAGEPAVLRRPWGPGWALVGDAGCFKDPLTAHGITDALRDAEMLARAVFDGSDDAFARYQSERDAFAVPFLDLSDEIASFEWDIERVQGLHRTLSKMMNAECDALRAIEPMPIARAAG
ncbi:MAG TPA: NAD(P)/FAD-dependent oxidoreductase [Candidatus Krumholzibacteria bacterium]|nr:NAD(P)/FAD-dependent oxidoreductase [Candidatus Krumholzibacteria bacterium]